MARISSRHLLPLAVLALFAARPAQALTINATMESSITTSAYATAIQNAITSAISYYSAYTDAVTVNIDFQVTTGAGYLGATYSSHYVTPYASYASALLADATANANAVEMTAYSNLSAGNMAQQIVGTAANFRALGFTAAGTLNSSGVQGGSYDGVIMLNGDLLTGFGGGGSYNSLSVIQHEVNEVLGIGGAGSVLNTMQSNGLTTPPTYQGQTYIGPMDLLRYSAAGTPSLTTNGGASAYLSFDGGVTRLVALNQDSNGDYGDWGAPTCTELVQQAFTCAGSTAAMTPNAVESQTLQAVGYDLPVPEPMSLALLGTGVIGLEVARRRRARSAG